MAIFHMSFSNISAGKLRSAVASAAYRSGDYLFDMREQKGYFYARKVMPEAFIMVPKNAPDWAKNRQKLWNEVERKESSANARYAKEFNVALPLELTSTEQLKLLKEYLQKNFVDQGMVADVGIHRDHPQNPHAHVMLTNRPFNPDGSWGEKSKKAYILDANGNKTYTKSGYARSRKIWLTDWDKKEKLNEWRHNWAKAVNRALAAKNIPDRISEKSYEAQGIDLNPTQHIGHSGQSKARAAYNETVKAKRQAQGAYQNAKDKAETAVKYNFIQEQLSYKEKGVIAGLSRDLKTYISLESLDDKKRMLFNWKNSLLIKHALGEDITQKISVVYSQSNAVKQADELLAKVADRTVKKLYPMVDFERTTAAERQELIKESDREGRVFGQAELADRLADIHEYSIEKQLTVFTNRPYTSFSMLEKQQKAVADKIIATIKPYGLSKVDIHKIVKGQFEQYPAAVQQVLASEIKQSRVIVQMKRVIKAEYSNVIKKAFPKAEIEKILAVQEEAIYLYLQYYNPELKPYEAKNFDDLATPQPQFSSREHQQGLAWLSGELIDDEIENDHLKRVLRHDGTVQLFIGECRDDSKIEAKIIDQAALHHKAEQQAKENYGKANIVGYVKIEYPETTPKRYGANLFDDLWFCIFYQNDQHEEAERRRRLKGLREVEWEMERKKREHETRNRHEGGGMHL